MVGSLHKRSFTTGFLKVQSWVQYSLLCTFNHCLKSFLEVGAVITHQLHQSSTPSDFDSLIVDVQCVDSVGRKMTGNRLKLNNNTEALLDGSRRSVSVSQDNHLTVGSHDTFISFKCHVHNLELYSDATVSMVKHTDHIRPQHISKSEGSTPSSIS